MLALFYPLGKISEENASAERIVLTSKDTGIGVAKEFVMSKALWISRHEATIAQLVQLSAREVTLVAEVEGKELGSRNLATDEDVETFMTDLHALIRQEKAEEVYGVFAVPVQHKLVQETMEICERTGAGWEDPIVSCFSAWNIQRTVEGQKPTFEHKRFIWVGDIFNIPVI